MASLPIMLILSAFLAINVKAQEKYSNTIPVGSSLSPINAKNISWRSSSGVFAFGFYPQGNGFALGIWLQVNQTDRIIVWTPNRDDPPFSSSATLKLTRKRGLLLRTHQDIEDKVITDLISSQEISSAAMLDDGNFQLLNGSHDVEWQSFDYPTDTILGGQVLSSGTELVSSISGSNQSRGPFSLRMQQFDGNLVSHYKISNEPEITDYWSSNTPGASDAELHLNLSGFLFISLYEYLPIGILSNGSDSGQNKSFIYRARLDSDGIFRLYSHLMVSNTSSTVKVMWSTLQNKCQVPGLCGLNSYCQVVGDEPGCLCSPGFAFINQSMRFLGCYQNFAVDSCRDIEDYTPRLRYNITSLKNMDWDKSSYRVETLKEEACRESCLGDCNCWMALSTDSKCQKFNFPLKFGRRSEGISTTALFKVLLENIYDAKDPNHAHPVPQFLDQSKNRTIILILGLSLGSVACLCLALAVLSFIVYKHRYRRYKKLLENANLGLDEDFTLQSFSYNELEQATNGFKEEKGRGTFGAVYKGVLADQGNKTIAVKRLEKVVEEGVREFRAEMATIGRTHHRNLVQLLGFCIEGSKKLLVYEFMSNGSLADRLFKATLRPTWRERVKFVFDVARGVFYLHEECGVHIIHCNLKPQNILLDDTWTAKISDFGLARLLMPNHAITSVGNERTSIGYFAPEWQKNALISVKSDIYSFGVVLLETICCRRNIELDVSTPDEITLSNWVYTCFKAGELDKLVEDEELDFPTLERMVKVGLWCVQDDPTLRPLMKNVILMLEGIMSIPVPPSPELLVLP